MLILSLALRQKHNRNCKIVVLEPIPVSFVKELNEASGISFNSILYNFLQQSESFHLLFLLLHALLPGLFREQWDNVPIVGVLANTAA